MQAWSDEGFELTAEDEVILDRIWAQIREEELSPTITETMTDEETLELFGLD